jgi:hypothetical protein
MSAWSQRIEHMFERRATATAAVDRAPAALAELDEIADFQHSDGELGRRVRAPSVHGRGARHADCWAA